MSVGSFEIGGVVYDIVPRATPGPQPDPQPVDANTVVLGGAEFPLAGVNPTRESNPDGANYLGCRGPNQLVAYRAPLMATPTNQYGAEASVVDGRVVALFDRQTTMTAGGTVIPPVTGGYVLSGHGRARDWLLTHASTGTIAELAKRDASPPSPAPAGGRTVALYLKRGTARSDQIPADVNQARIAFAQGNPLRLVDWGGETIAEQAARLKTWKAAGTGRQVLVSVGGSKGQVNPSDRVRFIQGFTEIEKDLGGIVDGIDWDLEGGALYTGFPADAVAISSSLAAGREDRFVVSFAPSGGSPTLMYLSAAVPCHKAGLRVQFGQQLYEAPSFIDEATALSALGRAIAAGLPPASVLVGCMVGDDQRHWTAPMCQQVVAAARKKWPTLGGAYLWSERYVEDDDWARRVRAVLDA